MIEYYYEGLSLPIGIYFATIIFWVCVDIHTNKDNYINAMVTVLVLWSPKFGYLFATIYYNLR